MFNSVQRLYQKRTVLYCFRAILETPRRRNQLNITSRGDWHSIRPMGNRKLYSIKIIIYVPEYAEISF